MAGKELKQHDVCALWSRQEAENAKCSHFMRRGAFLPRVLFKSTQKQWQSIVVQSRERPESREEASRPTHTHRDIHTHRFILSLSLPLRSQRFASMCLQTQGDASSCCVKVNDTSPSQAEPERTAQVLGGWMWHSRQGTTHTYTLRTRTHSQSKSALSSLQTNATNRSAAYSHTQLILVGLTA